jgi:hypothetical protein
VGSSWTVESQVNSQVERNGIFVDGVEITAQLSDNSQVTVDVDKNQYQTPTLVKQIIQAAVDIHDANQALSGP